MFPGIRVKISRPFRNSDRYHLSYHCEDFQHPPPASIVFPTDGHPVKYFDPGRTLLPVKRIIKLIQINKSSVSCT
jgi:hypothetical protein